MEEVMAILIVAIIFGSTYATIQLLVRRKERMAIIEKGIDVPAFNAKPVYNVYALKIGLLFIGVAIGVLLGSVLDAMTTLNTEAAYFSMVFLFGGIGLVLSHYLEKKEIKQA